VAVAESNCRKFSAARSAVSRARVLASISHTTWPAADRVAVAHVPADLGQRIKPAEAGVEPRGAGQYGVFAADDGAQRALVGGGQQGGQVAAADVLGEGGEHVALHFGSELKRKFHDVRRVVGITDDSSPAQRNFDPRWLSVVEGRLEAVGTGDIPEHLEYRMVRHTGQQFAGPRPVVQRRQRAHLGGRDAADHVLRAELTGMCEAGGAQHFLQRDQRIAMELMHPRRLVGDIEGTHAQGSWVVTPVGQWPVWQVWACRQPRANMKPRAELHQSAPVAMVRAMSKAVTILPEEPMQICCRRLTPTRVLCTSISPSRKRRADVVGEFQRRRAGAAFAAVDHDEVGRDAGPQHGLDDGEPFPGMADGELEADRLATRQIAQAGDEFEQFDRRRERREWRGGEMQSTPTGTPRASAISGRPWRRAGRRRGPAWRPARA
jgi:hypothetical protein